MLPKTLQDVAMLLCYRHTGLLSEMIFNGLTYFCYFHISFKFTCFKLNLNMGLQLIFPPSLTVPFADTDLIFI